MLGYYGDYRHYIHWASKFATSANKGNNKAAYYIHWASKLATSANKQATAKQVHNWNNFTRAQEMLSWVSTMLAISLASLLAFSYLALKSSNACCCTRKYASEFCRDFLSPSASCRSIVDRRLSACSSDSRCQTDGGSKFEELVPAVVASNSNTTSIQDLRVVSLSSR